MQTRTPSSVVVLLAGWLASMGCAQKVSIRVPAAPTVAMRTVSIRVSSADRQCRPLADRVAERIGDVPGMRVDPQASASLTLYGCTAALHPQSDGETIGSTAALAALLDDNGVVHILGSARQRFPNEPRLRAAYNSMNDQVADDLVEQIVPLPFTVRRRVYDNANVGTARALHNRAVRAEQQGMLVEALSFARQAQQLHPRPRSARYVAELTRRLSRTKYNAASSR